MYKLTNNVLGQLKYDIAGGALAIVVAPLPGTSFNLPAAPTDAAVPTYGQPYGLFALADRPDPSQAKFEIVIYSARAAEAAGAYTYTIPAAGRGREGTAAQAWVAGAYVMQVATENVFSGETRSSVVRAASLLVHKRNALMTWDGANFKFDTFLVPGAGRGLHWGTDGYFTITMPANATVVKGFGGAADTAVAAGAIPMAENQALYFEPYIAGPNATIAGNFKIVAVTADYSVPLHWILLAVHGAAVAGDKCLRMATGATLYPWRDVNTEGLFTNAWVNFGAPYANAAYRKDAAGLVYLRGAVKTGGVNAAMFTLPATYRPGSETRYAISSNAAFAELAIDAAGVVKMPAGGSNVVAHLNVGPFQAEG
jgi:hypothetical protein